MFDLFFTLLIFVLFFNEILSKKRQKVKVWIVKRSFNYSQYSMLENKYIVKNKMYKKVRNSFGKKCKRR